MKFKIWRPLMREIFNSIFRKNKDSDIELELVAEINLKTGEMKGISQEQFNKAQAGFIVKEEWTKKT